MPYSLGLPMITHEATNIGGVASRSLTAFIFYKCLFNDLCGLLHCVTPHHHMRCGKRVGLVKPQGTLPQVQQHGPYPTLGPDQNSHNTSGASTHDLLHSAEARGPSSLHRALALTRLILGVVHTSSADAGHHEQQITMGECMSASDTDAQTEYTLPPNQ